MNFEQIVLSWSELRLLRKSKKKMIRFDPNSRLVRHKLVYEIKHNNPGYMPEPTGFARISDLGLDYLAYIQRRFSEYRKTRALSIIAIVISALSLILQVWHSL